MKPDAAIDVLRARLDELRSRLEPEGSAAPEDGAAIRSEIIELSRLTASMMEQLEALREGIRPLAERYRKRFPRPPHSAPQTRADHLGGSAFRERGWSALAAGEYETAVGELRHALRLAPDEIGSRVLLAWALLRLGELDEPRSLIGAVLDEDPGHPLAGVALGFLRIREARFTDAVETLSAVTRGGSDRTAALYAHLYLGVVYAEREMHRDAQIFFRRALELGPNLTEAYWELGRSHASEGRHDLAAEAWRAGGENRFNAWGERCREAAERLARGGGSEAS